MSIEEFTNSEAIAFGAIAGGLLSTIIITVILLYVVMIVASWKIFVKAGEKGWKALIPIYNYYILFKIVNMKSWFWFTLCVSIILGLVISIDHTSGIFQMTSEELSVFDWGAHIPTVIALVATTIVTIWTEILYAWRTSKVFGHGVGYFIGLILLTPIFWLILGFGQSKYDKKNLKA